MSPRQTSVPCSNASSAKIAYRPKYSWSRRSPQREAFPGPDGPGTRGSVSPKPSTCAFSRSEIVTFSMAHRMIAPTQIDRIV